MLRMLAFAAANRVVPVVEELPMSRAGDAVKRLRANEARYRIVLDMDL
jgi:alcohol dehydrogenase (NADP+)